MDIQSVEREIQEIKERNKKVEVEKAWETSWMRKIVIAVLTYVVILLFFVVADLPNPFINALIPSVAFLLSTTSLSVAKKVWMKYFY